MQIIKVIIIMDSCLALLEKEINSFIIRIDASHFEISTTLH
jgi:hypothetical protein